jgi:uncharacterized repeat protein (TIGR02543 family)
MKKFLLFTMAVFMAFAMISCGGGGDDPPPPPPPPVYTFISFDLNYPSAPAVTPALVGADGKITLPDDPTRTGFTFVGWYKERFGYTARAVAGDTYDGALTLYASWDEVGKAKIIFNPNYPGADDPEVLEVDSGDPIEDTDVPDDPERVDYFLTTATEFDFVEWNYAADGSGDAFDVDTDTFSTRTILYAIWELNMDGYVETVTLNNANYVVYEFTASGGKTWADYKDKGLSAQYMLTQTMIDTGVARGNRVVGNIKVAHFNFSDGTGGQAGKHKAVTDYNSRNDILINNQGEGWGSYDPNTLKGALKSYLTEEPVAGKWFQINYPFPNPFAGSTNWNAVENSPADSSTGPWYFAVGLPGQGDGRANTFDIRKVTMNGPLVTAATDSAPAVYAHIVGKPVVFTATYLTDPDDPGTEVTNLFPAFTGYDTPNGSNGWGDAERVSKGKLTAPAIPVAFTIFNVTLDYNWPTEAGSSPADATKTTGRTGRLSSGDLSISNTSFVPAGYKLEGWYPTATTPVAADKINVSTVFANSTTTIYANWTKMEIPVGDIVYEYDAGTLEIGAFGGATNYNSEDGEYPMFSGAKNQAAGRGNSDSLLTIKLPEGSTKKYYTKIIVEYEAWLDDDADTLNMNAGTKNGYNQWGDVSPGQWRNFTERSAEGETEEMEFDFALFTYDGNDGEGFGFQANTGGSNSSAWWLKIHKVTIKAYVAP